MKQPLRAPSAGTAILALLCALPIPAEAAKGHKTVTRHQRPPAISYIEPPVISFVGGKNAHVTVAFFLGKYPPQVFRSRTPRGWVTVRWREDYGTEDGSPAMPTVQNDISHPDTIFHIVIVSPASLPVYFRGAGDTKWAHLNGNRLPVVKSADSFHGYPADPFRMAGGLNIVDMAYPDPE